MRAVLDIIIIVLDLYVWLLIASAIPVSYTHLTLPTIYSV